jgi:GNAT superfamily N-acetyltransferase
MGDPALPATLSELDRMRFGIVTAKAEDVTAAGVEAIVRFCGEHSVRLLIARCPAEDLSAAQTLERAGALLAGTLVVWTRNLDDPPLCAGPPRVAIREAVPADGEAVRALAGEAFHDFGGHYHMDRRLDRAACDALYADWAYRSCVTPGVADGVLVAARDDRIVGFVTMKLRGSEEGEGVLDAVAADFRGRGFHQALMLERLRWFQRRGVRRMTISTQVTNLAAQRSWLRLGLRPLRATYIFHKWFDGEQ